MSTFEYKNFGLYYSRRYRSLFHVEILMNCFKFKRFDSFCYSKINCELLLLGRTWLHSNTHILDSKAIEDTGIYFMVRC